MQFEAVALRVGSTLMAADPVPVSAPPAFNPGDTAWMLIASALVLFMTIPGLALFYGGLVRTKNVLSIFTQCFAVTCLVTVLWVLYGYSLAFSGSQEPTFGWHSLIGSLDKCGLIGVTAQSVATQAPTIPEPLFVLFQMTFAIITPALLIGAFAERMKFRAVLLISAMWLTVVYIPLCHMAWSGPGALMGGLWGLQDLAGGTVVEVDSGVAGLVLCVMVGRRVGFPKEPMLPHDSPMCIAGACMLWVGWFGFNAGSVCAANADLLGAALTTQIAAAAAGCTWMAIEWHKHGKAGALGVVTGAVAGLVGITPACGTVGPLGAIVIGAISGAASFLVVTKVKRALGYDDTLDVFGVHGVAGMVGLVLTGVFAPAWLGGGGLPNGHTWGRQILVQFALPVPSQSLVSAAGHRGSGAHRRHRTLGLRASENDEVSGLDYAEHGEEAYT